MSSIDEMQKEIVETQEFVRERLRPATKEVTLMREEQERLPGGGGRVRGRDRPARSGAAPSRRS